MGEHELGLAWGAWMGGDQCRWAGGRGREEGEACKLEELTKISDNILDSRFTSRLTWHLAHGGRVHSF
jgi:hypothetical protein